MQDVKKTNFSEDYRRANICSKFFFIFPNATIKKAKENNFQLTDEMVINMNLDPPKDGEDESYIEVKQFWA
jgi:hypothetical protein